MERIPELATLPVIFISGYDKDEMIARALEMGAGPITSSSPFSPTELAARVQAALRRRDDAPRSFQSGELIIHYEDRRVTLAGVSGAADGHRIQTAPSALGQRGGGQLPTSRC